MTTACSARDIYLHLRFNFCFVFVFCVCTGADAKRSSGGGVHRNASCLITGGKLVCCLHGKNNPLKSKDRWFSRMWLCLKAHMHPWISHPPILADFKVSFLPCTFPGGRSHRPDPLLDPRVSLAGMTWGSGFVPGWSSVLLLEFISAWLGQDFQQH